MKKEGLDLLNVEDLLEISTKFNVNIKNIKQSINNSDVIVIKNKGYRVLENDKKEEYLLYYIKALGSINYFFNEILKKKDTNKIISKLKSNIILDKEKFIKFSNDKIIENFNEEKKENINLNFEEFLLIKNIEKEKLNDIKYLWNQEFLYIPCEYGKEFEDNIIKNFGINENLVYKEIIENYIQEDFLLSDYNKSISINDKTLYEVDIFYPDIKKDKKINNDLDI